PTGRGIYLVTVVVFEITESKMIEALSAEAIAVYFQAEDGIHFRHASFAPNLADEDSFGEAMILETTQALRSKILPHGTGIVGQVIDENQAHITLDASSEEARYFGVNDPTRSFQIRSMMTVPISYSGEVYGAIQVVNKDPGSGETFFSRGDLELAEEVAGYGARVLHMVKNPGFEWPPEDLARYIARLAKVDYFELEGYEADQKLLDLVGKEKLCKFKILPLQMVGSRAIKAAIDNPLDTQRRDTFELTTDLKLVEVVVSPEPQILACIEAAYAVQAKVGEGLNHRQQLISDLEDKKRQEKEEREQKRKSARFALDADAKADSGPVVKFVEGLVEDAYARGASDIHIEPQEFDLVVRFRIDGVLHEITRIPISGQRPVTARLKIMSELDISERRLPQDGRIRFKEVSQSGLDFDLRVAICPMVFGEKTVMRILHKMSEAVSIGKLGYTDENLKLYMPCIDAPYGMVLHCGPTGSGKTTSLYAALAYRNTPDRNIQTAEDPVEYLLPGISQCQVKPAIGFTFARALRSYLRQDPDIILVGEVRDMETATVAVEAALTGHQVFSTLHTNDAAGTVIRLTEMGIEPFLVTGALICVVAQRLVRKLCPNCCESHEPTASEQEMLKLKEGEDHNCHKADDDGCPSCTGTGYKGRMGIHEILAMTEPVRSVCSNPGVTASDIHEAAVREAGMIPLMDDAVTKIKMGVTDINEILRNVSAL
ncbi:GspE/PulE family protein, partial [Planctomycetota bacterium]